MCGGGNCTLRGAPAVKAVERNYDRLDIAMSSILASTPAKESVREVQAANAKAAGKKKSEQKPASSKSSKTTKSSKPASASTKKKTPSKGSATKKGGSR